ncbi:MAG: AAA-like domain-containing protein [Candidatus Contendobacter sp.]|nr:AAA-like domain-containing protein [Candidatus Contendobacter sp.]MDG4557785.1 AAA-like domain-containing protein [Candidatus Contendobacter sp.]
MRFFNTAGPVNPALHYALPPLSRIDLDDVLQLIEQQKYFVLHAPRQTGKTSVLLALMELLNRGERYRCLYANIEGAQAYRGNVDAALRTVVMHLATVAEVYLNERRFKGWALAAVREQGGGGALTATLTRWSLASDLPVVLLLDEVDALVGDALISLLRQIRAGYAQRPRAFPQTVILCGVRDVRDYRLHTAEREVITGGSAFNIKAESLRLGNFRRDEVETLYRQHTLETGQEFAADVLDRVWELTRGQPWLVNALAYEVCFKLTVGRDRGRPISVERIEEAKENLIQRRETHLDQLADKLREPRVRRVIAPLLGNTELAEDLPSDDLQYVIDLGLVSREAAGPVVANRIYQEIIPRELSTIVQANFEAQFQPAWYIAADGRLDASKLLNTFQQFFREHADSWLERFDYREAGPQLLLQAFLQRIVNGGGRIDREYGLGRKRTDLLVQWPLDKARGFLGPVQRVVLELKLLHKSFDATLREGLAQTADYLDRTGTDEGHLLIFDRAPGVPWERKIFQREESHGAYRIRVWGM